MKRNTILWQQKPTIIHCVDVWVPFICTCRPSFRKCCKGGQKYSFIKIGGASHKSVCDSTRPLGGSGGMPPQEIFVFRLSEIESGAFSGTTLTVLRNGSFGSTCIHPCDIVKHNSI